MKKPSLLALSLCLGTASAQATDEAAQAQELPNVEVQAAHEADTAPGVEKLPIERLQRNQAKDMADIFRDESSIIVGGGSRNAQRLYLRGIEASTLNVTVDGARQGRNLFQHRGNIGGMDPELLKSVEVQTTPSADQGAGALGGSIRFETADAQDLLAPGRRLGGMVRGAYGSVDQALRGSTSLYGLLGEHAGLLAHVSATNFEDYKAGGGETVNGSAGQDRDYFVKFSLLDAAGHSLRASAERNRNSGLYRYAAADGAYDPDAPLTYQISQRETYVLDHRYRKPGNDLIDWKFNVFKNELSLENLSNDTLTESQGMGGKLRNIARFSLGPTRHSLTAGLDYYSEEGIETRSNVQKGNDNNARNTGLYLQERMNIGPVLLSVGARHDDYSSDFGPVNVSGSKVSPNASIEVEMAGGLSGHLAYGEAVRSTGIIPIQWLSNTTGNPTFNTQKGKDSYGRAFEPETSKQKEIGLRYTANGLIAANDRLQLGATVFETDIENLIQQIGGSQGKPVTGFYNDDPVTTKGYELRASWMMNRWQTRLSFTHADTTGKDGQALAVTRRKGASTGDRLVWDTLWRVRDDLNLGYTLTGVAGLHRDSIDRSGYTLHHIQAEWSPAALRGVSLALAVRNLTDKRYSEQSSIGTDDTAVDEPGRDIRLTATYRF
ncbi:MAG: TonB-dependent receptor [Halothiobacillaceae bacterium]|nr:TonB-dependent receptor [Halothiobacillaceae bacterium]